VRGRFAGAIVLAAALAFPAYAQDLIASEMPRVRPAPIAAPEIPRTVVDGRRRIEAYLTEKFRERRISPDLLLIVMRRIDAFITNDRNWRPEEHPETTSYPSVALQIVWQDDLQKIAADFEYDFPAVRIPRTNPVIIEDAPRVAPSVNSVYLFAGEAIVEAQGHLGEELREHPLGPNFRFGKNPSQPRKTLGHYRTPVRIAPTSIALVDQTIPSVLAEIRMDHPESPIDEASFPAAPAAANLIIPQQRFGGYGRWKALACARAMFCRSLADFVRYGRPDDSSHSAKDRFAFLDSIYLTNPYGERYGTTAVVQIGKDRSIVSAFCSIDDIRYSPGLVGGPPLRRENLLACLEEAMGY
jgi:hypothetical protein